MYIYRCKR